MRLIAENKRPKETIKRQRSSMFVHLTPEKFNISTNTTVGKEGKKTAK